MSDTLLVYQDTYTWSGGCGAVFKSRENGVALGTVRLIAGELFYAYLVYNKKIFKNEVCWSFVDKNKNAPACLREFKKAVFCMEG